MKKYLGIVLSALSLIGCSTSQNPCGSDPVKEALKQLTLERYPASIRSHLDIEIKFIEEKKESKGDFLHACAANLRVKFKDSIIRDYESLKSDISKFNKVPIALNEKEEDLVDTDYVIKKNQAENGNFIQGTFKSKLEFKLPDNIISQINERSEIIAAVELLQNFRTFVAEFGGNSIDGSSVMKNATDNKLAIEYCEEKMLDQSIDHICRISNSAGYIDVVNSNKLDFQGVAVSQLFRLGAAMRGESSNSIRRITDQEQILQFINQKKQFSISDEGNESKACKMAPSICR